MQSDFCSSLFHVDLILVVCRHQYQLSSSGSSDSNIVTVSLLHLNWSRIQDALTEEFFCDVKEVYDQLCLVLGLLVLITHLPM